ncbi:MAG: MFS transporter [Clostridia bacterium]|nr:MFS transporter [Clostridia bacterium]
MKQKNFRLTKLSCFYANMSMSSVFSLPPLLFVTFRETYGISYTLLGTLVLVNFCTQFSVDMIFTFFAKYFNIKATIRTMPLLTSTGLIVYALSPVLFKGNEYTGFLIGTFIFSVAAGLAEVLISPMVAAIPSKTPDRDMSFFHSLYAWGVVGVTIISTIFFIMFGNKNWMYLTLALAILPIISSILFFVSPMPDISLGAKVKGNEVKKRKVGLLLCFACIFFGGAAENVMTNWISGFMEKAIEVPKAYGDVFGMALFALFLGFARTLYSKYGKNIFRVLLLGSAGAAVCYLVAGLSENALIAFVACVLTGFTTGMLWPGTLILMEEKMPNPGVAAYALLAAGGDFGGSIAPQLMGFVADSVAQSSFAQSMSYKLNISTEQIGLKSGMIITSIFPILGVVVLLIINKHFSKTTKTE